MYLRELIDKLIDELECNGNHKVYIEHYANYDGNIKGIRVVTYTNLEGKQTIYYITNNL